MNRTLVIRAVVDKDFPVADARLLIQQFEQMKGGVVALTIMEWNAVMAASHVILRTDEPEKFAALTPHAIWFGADK